ncbi:hypothetical protein D3C83_293790 [compost metagenome]
MAAKVADMPSRSGSVLRTNGCSLRAKTKGSTGSTQGLRIVSTPPRNARNANNMLVSAGV